MTPSSLHFCRKELVGPIYSTGKIADERVHHFTQGYQAPLSAEQKAEKMRLVKKFFQQQQKATDTFHQKVVAKVEGLKQQQSEVHVRSQSESRVSREEARERGEARRQEAVQRRQQFLQEERETMHSMSQKERMVAQQERFIAQQEDQRSDDGGGQRQACHSWQQTSQAEESWSQQAHQQVTQSQAKQTSKSLVQTHQVSQTQAKQVTQTKSQAFETHMVAEGSRSALEEAARRLTATVKTRQQLEAERDAMVSQTLQSYQLEASVMAERQKTEERMRVTALAKERERLEKEEVERADRSRRMEEERQQKMREEQEKIKQMEIERKRREQIARENILEKAEEKRQQLEKIAKDQREDIQKRQEEDDARKQRKLDEEAKAAQRREQEQLRRVKQQEAGSAVSGRSPQVARRTDDLHGLGFGQVPVTRLLEPASHHQVKTGSVMSRKISLLTRAGSLEPDLSETESPAPR